MKNPFKKGDQIANITDRIGKFEQGLANLQRRRDVFEDVVGKAKDRRRQFIQENPAVEIPNEIRQAINNAEVDVRSTGEEIVEYEAQIAKLQAELEEAISNDKREGAAFVLEAKATAIDKAVANLATAMKNVGASITALRATLPETSPFEISEYGGRPKHREERNEATPREALAMIVAESLAREAPDLFDRFSMEYGRAEALFRFFDLQRSPNFHSDISPEAPALDAAAAAKVLISDRLRRKASEIKAGRLPPEWFAAAE